MATMLKEKRKEKKKSKEKSPKREVKQELQDSKNVRFKDESKITSTDPLKEDSAVKTSEGNNKSNAKQNQKEIDEELQEESVQDKSNNLITNESDKIVASTTEVKRKSEEKENYDSSMFVAIDTSNNEKKSCKEELVDDGKAEEIYEKESILPSAPVFEDQLIALVPRQIAVETEIAIKKSTAQAQCLPLEEAVRIFGGKEISEVRIISEKEEALVEGGPVSGPEHPLVDLLTTFRCSLKALERCKTETANGKIEEEKLRNSLWKVYKRRDYIHGRCSCGHSVGFTVNYEDAVLQRDKIPAARMRLEALSREFQDTYCHHQHSAFLVHSQIEELVYETNKRSKHEIRETLSLILQELRLSDSAPDFYSKALQRWAVALSDALLEGCDLKQLIFLIHHLFRQTRSVRWASRVIRVEVTDVCSAARAVALLELMLARSGLETAVECTEGDLDEVWEEVGKRGEGSAVSEGRLREWDAVALLRTLPLRQMVAKMVLFTRSDVSTTREGEWGDNSGGHGVMKVACGVRTLLSVVKKALCAHPHYQLLKSTLRDVCKCALEALTSLHMQSKEFYHPDVESKVALELNECFARGREILDPANLDELPTRLLSEGAAKEFCLSLIYGMHDEMEDIRCDVRVRTLVRASLDRADDSPLARVVLNFLFQTGIKRTTLRCKHGCVKAARVAIAQLLNTHPYLHVTALKTLADLHQDEPLHHAALGNLPLSEWRPSVNEVVSVLEDWWKRCPHFVQHLLLHMDFTPHRGVFLDAQLAIGQWLCGVAASSPEIPEWAWQVLTKLRVHRSHWSLPLEAPPPSFDTDGLMHTAFALVATSWGHSVPVICTEGVHGLLRLARARANDAAHCLAMLMRVMRQSPESIALTPEFTEVISAILGTRPSLVARYLCRGGPSGTDALQLIILDEISAIQPQYSVGAMSSWVRALWVTTLPSDARALLDTAMRASRDWPALDSAVVDMLQGERSKDFIQETMRDSSVAPLLCEALLRGLHAQAEASSTWPRLLEALQQQRTSRQRPHLNNALRQIGVSMNTEDLVIYRVASAVLSAPFHHPAHLTLWRLFFHLYLQRPPSNPQESTPPIGPMFFSGIIKSITFGQLKKRLQETISHHQIQADLLKPQVEPVPKPEVPTTSKDTKDQTEPKVYRASSITNLTGEPSSTEWDTDSSEEEMEKKGETGELEENVKKDSEVFSREIFHLHAYHVAAEKLVREYSHWLEEGDKVRASPHHADLARFISEQSLNAAWRSFLPKGLKGAPPPTARAPEKPPPTHLEAAIKILSQISDNSTASKRVQPLKPPLADQSSLINPYYVFNLAENPLKQIEALAKEWADDVNRLAKLDAKVWDLVGALRVRRALPPVFRTCDRNCKPIKLLIQKDEWVISTGAEQGIKQNRKEASAVLKRLIRPRHKAARAAAALLTIARHVRTSETARRIAERVGNCADQVWSCPPARVAIASFIELLAERWLCADATACGELLSRWARGGVGLRGLCGALVRPRRLPPADAAHLYRALLAAPLPPDAAFSYLSRFEMSSWAGKVDYAEREKILDVLVHAAQRWGPYPDPEYNILLELIGVHATAVCCGGASEFCMLAVRCSKASACAYVPPSFCAHVAKAANVHAHTLDSKQLGTLLRELGAVWWEARSIPQESQAHELYATHVADTLHVLQLAYVAATKQLGHNIEQLSWFAWSALRESWSPWVQPGTAPPLLPTTQGSEAYSVMMQRFVDCIQDTIDHCPDGHEYILKYTWEWIVHTFMSVGRAGTQEDRVQLSALLAALAGLEWERPWMHATCLLLGLQVSRTGDKEICGWCSATWRRVAAPLWLRGLPDDQTAPHLAALLELFCSPHIQLSSQTIEEAVNLPWWRLPEAALDMAWEQFAVDHHNPAVPYHDLPQFRILLAASQLVASPGPSPARSVGPRCRGISQWVRAAATPYLLAHVPKHADTLLATITHLAPHINDSEGELEELLKRAIVIMCFEPAAGASLPVWQQWISTANTRLRLACASAVASLTTLDYFAPLAEATAKAHMACSGGGGWESLRGRWSCCVWEASAACSACASRGLWHAAYALLPDKMADADTDAAHVAVLRALAAHDLAAEDETAMTAVWVSVACRLGGGGGGGGRGRGGGRETGRALLERWACEPRRSLLQVVGIQQDHAARVRMLCRLAQCILDPTSDILVKAYEAACTAVLGSNPSEVTSWGKAPQPLHLPRLALRLFPENEPYFKKELEFYEKM